MISAHSTVSPMLNSMMVARIVAAAIVDVQELLWKARVQPSSFYTFCVHRSGGTWNPLNMNGVQ